MIIVSPRISAYLSLIWIVAMSMRRKVVKGNSHDRTSSGQDFAGIGTLGLPTFHPRHFAVESLREPLEKSSLFLHEVFRTSDTDLVKAEFESSGFYDLWERQHDLSLPVLPVSRPSG
jgi:hypothetical protein